MRVGVETGPPFWYLKSLAGSSPVKRALINGGKSRRYPDWGQAPEFSINVARKCHVQSVRGLWERAEERK